jgi:hypothetical protein
MSNDSKIKEFRTKVEAKRAALGDKPRLAYVTNGQLDLNGNRINFNTVNTEEKCMEIVRYLLTAQHFTALANEILQTNIKPKFGDFTVEQWIEDIKQRVKLIVWERNKKKLVAMDKQLAALMSDDARTADAIANIGAQLEE